MKESVAQRRFPLTTIASTDAYQGRVNIHYLWSTEGLLRTVKYFTSRLDELRNMHG